MNTSANRPHTSAAYGHGIVISILVCTRNRACSLARTLRSITNCDWSLLPDGEIVVVDNGCTDHTAQVVDGFAGGSIPVRRSFEPVAGLSNARNRGIHEAQGQVLLWTDDDVLVPPSWVQSMAMPLLSGAADAAAGEVVIPSPLLSKIRGTPLETRLGWVASTDEIDFSWPNRMVGANMAFSRRVLEVVPEFDARLGAGPNSLGFYEETLFARQLLRAGLRIKGVAGPEAAVEHHFDLERITLSRLIDMSWRLGRSKALADAIFGDPVPQAGMRARCGVSARFLKRCLAAMATGNFRRELSEARIERAWEAGYNYQSTLRLPRSIVRR